MLHKWDLKCDCLWGICHIDHGSVKCMTDAESDIRSKTVIRRLSDICLYIKRHNWLCVRDGCSEDGKWMNNIHSKNVEQADPLRFYKSTHLRFYKSTHVAAVIKRYIYKYGDCMLSVIGTGLLWQLTLLSDFMKMILMYFSFFFPFISSLISTHHKRLRGIGIVCRLFDCTPVKEVHAIHQPHYPRVM